MDGKSTVTHVALQEQGAIGCRTPISILDEKCTVALYSEFDLKAGVVHAILSCARDIIDSDYDDRLADWCKIICLYEHMTLVLQGLAMPVALF